MANSQLTQESCLNLSVLASPEWSGASRFAPQAVRAQKPAELQFSVYEDADAREAILEDVTVPLPAVRPQKRGCGPR